MTTQATRPPLFRRIRLVAMRPELLPLVREVADALGRCQPYFELVVDDAPVERAPERALRAGFVAAVASARQSPSEMVFGVTSAPNLESYFGASAADAPTAFCTTFGWAYLSPLPEQAFVAFQCAAYALRLSAPALSLHDDTRGCVQDLCGHKADFHFKLRTADLCPSCGETAETNVEPDRLAALVSMLEEARRVALRRTAPDVSVRATTLAERIDESFPFPIAYSFRQMQVETSHQSRFRQLLQVAEITLRYVASLGMAVTARIPLDEHPKSCASAYPTLGKPTMGHWMALAHGMLHWLGTVAPEKVALPRLAASIASLPRSHVPAFARAAQELTNLRNKAHGHDFVRTPQSYEDLIREHHPVLDDLLSAIEPLAAFPIVKPVESTVRITDEGHMACTSKRLVGSHHVFRTAPLEARVAFPTSHCYLLDPSTEERASLSPWVHYEPCPACGHEMVSIVEGHENGVIVLRELGSSHAPRRFEGKVPEAATKFVQRKHYP
jgi:hypothetical protein